MKQTHTNQMHLGNASYNSGEGKHFVGKIFINEKFIR